MIHPSALSRFRLDPRITHAFPEARLGVIIGYGLTNGPSGPRSQQVFADATAALRQRLGDRVLKDHPRIAGWREVYQRFGAKPSRFPCSAEALATRALKDQMVSINALVDHYNAISIEHLIPIGGEDLDATEGDIVLRFADGGEHFEIPDDPAKEFAVVPGGEVIWSDALGVTCRRWNWRQGRRTRLSETTRNAYFIVEALAPSISEEQFLHVMGQLENVLRGECAARSIEKTVLR